MLTPAQRYVQQAVARNRVTMSTRETQRERTAHEQVLHQLRLAQQQLKGVQSNIARAELKRHLLPDFEGWIEGTLAGNSGRQDEVITTMMVWAIDCRDYPLALRIGEYVIRHGLALPDNFGRDAATVLTEEIAEIVLTQAATNSDADLSGYTVMLDTLHGLVHDQDMPDQVRAKLNKARAFSRRASTQPDDIHQSLMLLREAMRLNPAAGVKRDIATLERAVKKLSSPPPDPVKKSAKTTRKTGNSQKTSAKKKPSTRRPKNTH
ncbi:TPA: terminase [Escherichia coli O146]|nr:phage terminase small subunit [Escherichia coli]HBC2954475.1 terminase [Escherichia coli O146]HBC3156167.1 terminase [Escherichia coli O146]HBC3228927.1 terminase [Escherichia coli O146]HBC3233893.1 terminase [Escherichia coli O146]